MENDERDEDAAPEKVKTSSVAEPNEKGDERPSPSRTSEIEVQLDSVVEWSSYAAADDDCLPPVPEVPAFCDNLTLSVISPQIERILALKLDLPAVGDCLRNWEWLASSLGMSVDEIKYLHARVLHPSSPTIVLLRKYKLECLGRVLRIICHQMNRFDIIIEIMPLLLALEESLKVKGDSKKDSGVQLSNGSKANSKSNDSLCTTVSVGPYFANAKSGDIPDSLLQGKKDAFILVTYYADDEKHVKNVKWLCQTLKQYCSEVVNDYNLLIHEAQDLMSGVEKVFKKATYIIVACSPAYSQFIEKYDDKNDNGLSAVHNQHVQYARYLFCMMFDEYKERGCKNRRFRPLLFGQATMDHVPSFLKTTLVYRWPHDFNAFMNFLFESNQTSVNES